MTLLSPTFSWTVATHEQGDRLLACLASMKAQLFQDFEVIVMHEPSPRIDEARRIVERLEDPRFNFVAYPHRMEDWGNTVKDYGTRHYAKGRFVGHSNGDNYFCPKYLSYMLVPLVQDEADFVYCDHTSHHFGYGVRPNTDPLGRWKMDGSGWICRREIVEATSFFDKEMEYADGVYAECLAKKCRLKKIERVLWTHN